MPTKTQPIGICDHCLGPIPPGQWRTRRGPRLYCSLDCRNTANSRAGAEERGRKARDRVQAGAWQNPAKLHPPDPANLSAGARRLRLLKSAFAAGYPCETLYQRERGEATYQRAIIDWTKTGDWEEVDSPSEEAFILEKRLQGNHPSATVRVVRLCEQPNRQRDEYGEETDAEAVLIKDSFLPCNVFYLLP